MADKSVASQAGSTQANQQDGGSQNATAAASGGSSSSPKLSGAALWTAIVALVVWVAFSIVVLFNIGKSETEWTRITWVFGSIQSVAFAAAGALFGTAVQQQNVSSAKQEASSAKQEASSAKQDADQQRETAIKGRALAAVVQAEAATPSADDATGLESMETGRADATESAEALRQRHAQVSRSLFGDLVEPHNP
jgi:hypothetical protein